MKIFPKDAVASPPDADSKPLKGKSATKAAQAIARKKAELPAKKDIAPSEIREKLAARVETSEAAKSMAIKNSKKLGAGFLNDDIKAAPVVEVVAPEIKSEGDGEEAEVKTPNTKDFVLNSDIAKNDPKDSNTQEKLKSVLQRGGFSFNPKERDALEKILANQG